MNRHARRKMAALHGRVPEGLGQAAGQLQEALKALESIKGMESMTAQIAESHQLITATYTAASALVEDCQGMADEIEALKAMVFKLAGEGAEEAFRRQVAQIQAQRADETTSQGTA